MDKISTTKVSKGASSDTEIALTSSEINASDNEELFLETESSRPSSPTPTPSPVRQASPSFFRTPYAIPQVQLTLDPQVLLLWTALIEELRTRNDIELVKIKLADLQKQQEAEQKQQEIEAAKKLEEEDQKRFEELRPTMYS